jgi:hypothetical protein
MKFTVLHEQASIAWTLQKGTAHMDATGAWVSPTRKRANQAA